MKYLWLVALMTCVFATTLASAEDDKKLHPSWDECRLDDHITDLDRTVKEAEALAREIEIEVRQKGLAGDSDSILQDYKKAANAWLQKTTEQGRAWIEARLAWLPAQLGEMYYNGTIVPQNYDKAIRLLQEAAEQGSASAQARLGEIYYSGTALPQNYAKAARWFQKAAKHGAPSAQNRLGEMYYNGECVRKDYAKAAELFKKAAEQENISAQARLGDMYYDGHGVPQDYNQAIEWFKKAAYQGNASAQDGLGVMHRDGKSVPKNTIHAYAWFNIAATGGNNSAERHRSAIKKDMTLSAIAEGQNLTNQLLEQIRKDN